MSGPFREEAKNYAYAALQSNYDALALLNDSLFYFGELGMQEFRSAELMCSLLEEHGFTVERGISGFPTAFLATYGSGGPVIALHSEYDALPSSSQVSGVTTKTEITPGAPGHCEGHNVNGAVLIAAALAARHAMEKYNLPGTLKIFGAPAEEQGLTRPYFVRDGYFDDVDIAFHNHLLDEFKSEYGLIQVAKISAVFEFKGESAHSAVGPWLARDALDAAVLMDMGMAQFREHMLPEMTAHRVITNGGDQPNMIPDRASVYWYFRAPLADAAKKLFEDAQRIARGAAMMANCEVDINVVSAIWPVRGNQTLAEVTQRNIEAIGMPVWTEEEQRFTKELQASVGRPQIGLRNETTPMNGPARQIPASNDCGDISWKVPMARLWFPSNVPHAAFHNWSAGAPLATSIAHKGAVAGAGALATSVLDFLIRPELAEEAKQTFRKEIEGVVYEPLLPAHQKPPTDLNADVMEKYRSQMEKHYLKERPRFTF